MTKQTTIVATGSLRVNNSLSPFSIDKSIDPDKELVLIFFFIIDICLIYP